MRWSCSRLRRTVKTTALTRAICRVVATAKGRIGLKNIRRAMTAACHPRADQANVPNPLYLYCFPGGAG
jgi:hypothetical protein